MEVTSKEMSKNSLIDSSSNLGQGDSDFLGPILIGYAFGPKKLKTMAKVMDQASKEVISVSVETMLQTTSKEKNVCLKNEKNKTEAVVSCNSNDHPLNSTVESFSLNNSPSMPKSVKVSFVPINLDIPLKQQHGGKFDVILHKMTEDILYLASMKSDTNSKKLENDDSTCLPDVDEDCIKEVDKKDAIRRIDQLKNYTIDFPYCSIVNHPDAIQKLMCRADTSRILSECLVDVTTIEGIPVRTPQFIVVKNDNETKSVAKQIDCAPFTYPLIAKPVPAAGTAESHKMVIVRRRDGLDELHPPYLLQEFVNHSGKLYKVYVMGDNVWVFARPSLPDLPAGENVDNGNHDESFFIFDSQKPYPCVSDFNISDDDSHRSTNGYKSSNNTPMSSEEDLRVPKEVTSSELKPIVNALREAFLIDLFGFDILISSTADDNETGSDSKELLVVDVNYFPSYKEVSNFHEILAQYLLQLGMEGRINSLK